MSYIVIELQTNADGTVGNLVWSYTNQEQAESKFHAVLSAAAISTIPVHACSLLSGDGRLLNRGCYEHGTSTPEEVEA